MWRFSLNLLGGFEIRDVDGRFLSLPTRKDRALLAYLVLKGGRPTTRSELTALLWPQSEPSKARQSLRQSLSTIRSLGEASHKPWLASIGDSLRIETPMLNIDLVEFRRLCESPSADDWMLAARLCRGDLLQGIDISEQPFNDWLVAERNQFRDFAGRTFDELIQKAISRDFFNDAVVLSQTLVLFDPLREEAHRMLMRLYRDVGRTSDALQQYRRCRATLSRELNVEPDTETEELHQELLRGRRSMLANIEAPAISTSWQARPLLAIEPFHSAGADPRITTVSQDLAIHLANAIIRSRSVDVLAQPFFPQEKGHRKDCPGYLLAGRLGVFGEKIRTTVQLSETRNGQLIWGHSYDLSKSDFVEGMDDVVQRIAGTVTMQVIYAEAETLKGAEEDMLDAQQGVFRGIGYMNELTPKMTEAALRVFLHAIRRDPRSAWAHACVAWCYRRRAQLAGATLSIADQERAKKHVDRAVELQPADPFVLFHAAEVKAWFERDLRAALAMVERSLEIDPTSTRAWTASAELLCMAGRPAKALEHAMRAIEISPRDPSMWVPNGVLSGAMVQLGRFEEAANRAQRSIAYNPFNWSAHCLLAASLGQMGRKQDAQEVMQKTLRVNPHFALDRFDRLFPVRDYRNLSSYLEGLRTAGMPREAPRGVKPS